MARGRSPIDSAVKKYPDLALSKWARAVSTGDQVVRFKGRRITVDNVERSLTHLYAQEPVGGTSDRFAHVNELIGLDPSRVDQAYIDHLARVRASVAVACEAYLALLREALPAGTTISPQQLLQAPPVPKVDASVLHTLMTRRAAAAHAHLENDFGVAPKTRPTLPPMPPPATWRERHDEPSRSRLGRIARRMSNERGYIAKRVATRVQTWLFPVVMLATRPVLEVAEIAHSSIGGYVVAAVAGTAAGVTGSVVREAQRISVELKKEDELSRRAALMRILRTDDLDLSPSLEDGIDRTLETTGTEVDVSSSMRRDLHGPASPTDHTGRHRRDHELQGDQVQHRDTAGEPRSPRRSTPRRPLRLASEGTGPNTPEPQRFESPSVVGKNSEVGDWKLDGGLDGVGETFGPDVEHPRPPENQTAPEGPDTDQGLGRNI